MQNFEKNAKNTISEVVTFLVESGPRADLAISVYFNREI